MANLETKLLDVIGDRTAKVVESELSYKFVGDLLHHYPRRYVRRGELTNIAELKEGEEATVLAKVHSVKSRRLQNRKGVIVEANSVISMGVYIGQSTKIYDRTTGEILYGRVPSGSVVVPGSLPAADGSHALYCAVIVKRVDAQTRSKTAINDLLRD